MAIQEQFVVPTAKKTVTFRQTDEAGQSILLSTMSSLDVSNQPIVQIAPEQEPHDLNSLQRTNQLLAQLLKTELKDSVCACSLELACKGALYAAASRGDRPTVQQLIAHSVLDHTGNRALLNDAVLSLDNNALRILIECGLDPEKRDREQWTALGVACKHNRYDAARLLINEPRVNIHSVNGTGRSALSLAAEYGWIEILDMLLHDPRVDINYSY